MAGSAGRNDGHGHADADSLARPLPTRIPKSMQYDYECRKQIPVYANGLKDVPDRLRKHDWMAAIKFDQLSKYQLKVHMCCEKCMEKVEEEIWEVRGVFDVRAVRPKKVVVVAMQEIPNRDREFQDEVLRKAKKIDCRAKFVELDATERKQPTKPQGQPQGGQQQNGKQPKPPEGQQEHRGVINVVYPPPGGSNISLYQPSPPYDRRSEPPNQEDFVHYFHLLLLAVFLIMLILR